MSSFHRNSAAAGDEAHRVFRLLCACCTWPRSAGQAAAVARAAEVVDWALFVKAAERHRVEGLVSDALATSGAAVPAEVTARLHERAVDIARQNVSLAAESARLRRDFDAARLPILFLKGLTVAKLAYGSISLKSGWDIDLLVPLARVGEAARILRAADYRCVVPEGEFSDAQFLAWHDASKESVWRHRALGAFVELHSRMVDNPVLLPSFTVETRRDVQVTEGIVLPTLPGAELYAYLCVHGTASGWHRMKWIADVAALLGSEAMDDADALHRHAVELGVGRASSVALLLAESMFGLALGDQLRVALKRDPVVRRAVRLSLDTMGRRYLTIDPMESLRGTVRLRLMSFVPASSWRSRFAEVSRQLASPYDRVLLPLPRPLRLIYPILLVRRWLQRRSARRRGLTAT